MSKKNFFVVAYEGGNYYSDPDDKLNTSAPLVLARRYELDQLRDAEERAVLEGGTVELWEFDGDTPVRQIPCVKGAKVTGPYGNKTPVIPLDLTKFMHIDS